MYTTNMIRTQIYIPETIHQRTQLIARQQKKSMADLYRSFITSGLYKEDINSRQSDLTLLAKLNVKGGPKNLSRDMDKYLYENR